jgi:hypothetical protein
MSERKTKTIGRVKAVTVYWLDDSGAIPAGMSEDLSGWWWERLVDEWGTDDENHDGPFATKQDAIAASQGLPPLYRPVLDPEELSAFVAKHMAEYPNGNERRTI